MAEAAAPRLAARDLLPLILPALEYTAAPFAAGFSGTLSVRAETVTDLQGPHNDDLWDCLPDGTDPDLQSDGCIRIATLNDLTAEWTGGIFDASGRHFYVSVQHNITGNGVLLDLTGWS